MPEHSQDPGASGKKWYDEEAVTQWYIDNKEPDQDLAHIDKRKKIADTVLAELKVVKANYKAIDVKLVLSIYKEQVENIAAKIKSIPTIIASNISDVSTYGERLDIVETEVIELLKLLQVDTYTMEQWANIARNADTE